MIEAAVDKDYDPGRFGIAVSSIEGTREFASIPRGRSLRSSIFDFREEAPCTRASGNIPTTKTPCLYLRSVRLDV